MTGLRASEPNHPLTARRRQGVVVDVAGAPTSINVNIGGDTTTLVPCAYLTDYPPEVGDTVLLLENGGDFVVVGALAGLSPAGRGLVGRNASSTAASTTTTTEVKDTNVGDLVFTAAGTHALYRVKYRARAQSDAAATSVDYRIRDGGGSSPTNGSTQLAGASIYLAAASGAGASQLICEEEVTGLAAGTHTIAGFYVRTSGAGNVNPGQATGQVRALTVERLA